MKLVLISDTHNQHRLLGIPPCDLLIHAGDFTGLGTREEAHTFYKWFAKQPAKHRVLIAGNHDVSLEPAINAGMLLFLAEDLLRIYGIHFLCDSGFTIEGLKIWGSPYTPRFGNWAFYEDRGPSLKRHWDKTPLDTDILVTHGPPLGIGDRNMRGEHVGCADLLEAVKLVNPRLHVYGHVHEGHGRYNRSDLRTEFANVASLTAGHDRIRPPVVIDMASGTELAGDAA